MYTKLVDFATPDFGALLNLRDAVLRKPLGLEFTTDQIAEEYDSLHLGCYSMQNELLGVLVLKPISNNQVKMRQVAVSPDHQRTGIGQFMVASSEVISKSEGFEEIVLSARLNAVPFYEKLDYETISDVYLEVGIEHKKMRKVL